MGALRGAFSRFLAADGLFLSAGLAFFFLVCMIPLILLGVSIVGFVLSREEAAREVVAGLTRQFPVYKREITRGLLRIVETRKVSGILGTVILVFFSTPLFGATRLVMHRLIGVKARGNFFRNLIFDALRVLVLGALLFAATVATWLVEWFEVFVLEPVRVPSRWINAASIGLSLGLSSAMFFVVYRYVPRRRLRVGSALAGAILAGVLWEIAKQLFRFYIRSVGVYDQIYGPLGVLIAFVMFVYYSAVVFVLGACYAAAWDARRR